ncbi:hypothetical protein ANCDUO_11927 [Ancylostoma duodenale]|uniref:BRCT domain-containing protein n=1 Tax=Ancylostoma duodenale TaxID=51022 RepID=A0A0C2GGE7_9BILA|nr:hypothetical protein ANCDUO_11927 [Ancylostoma duodenale]
MRLRFFKEALPGGSSLGVRDQRSVSGCRDVVLHDLTNELGHISHGNVSEDRRSVSGCRDVVLHDLTNELGHISHGNVSEDVEVTFSRTMNASELLLKLDLLSKRLDKIGGRQQRINLPGLSCTRTAQNARSTVRITRRRTHGAFPLEYRDPSSDAVEMILEAREEQDAVCGRSVAQRSRNLDPPKENEEPRCTQADELPYTLKKTVVAGTKSAGSKKQKGPAAARSPQKCLAPVENSSELGGLLGLKTPSQCGVYGPLVETASSLINQLQSASSSAEFVGKRHTTRIVSKNRDGVVFTGFIKEKERELYPYVRDLGLKVHSKISGRTYCVVSANGERTLNTMRAVVTGIKVVTQEWIEMCSDHNRLLPLEEFEHVRWKDLIRKRGQNCTLFADYGKIMVCEGCSPPSYDIQWLIEESGGEITTDPTECSLIVAPHQHSLEILCSEEMEVPPPVVVEKYILDCICENAVLDVDDYQEHQVVDDLL